MYPAPSSTTGYMCTHTYCMSHDVNSISWFSDESYGLWSNTRTLQTGNSRLRKSKNFSGIIIRSLMVIYIVHHRDYAVGKFVDSIIVHITILAAIAIGTYNYTISVGGGLISFQHTTASYFGRSSIVRQSNSRPDHSSGTSNLPAFFPLLVSRFS